MSEIEIKEAIAEMKHTKKFYSSEKSFNLAISALEKQLNDKWIKVSERLPKACYKSGDSEEILITLGWFYNNGEFNEIDNEQYIGYFSDGRYNDYLECEEDERLEMQEILNDCWNVYQKGHSVTVDLTKNRRVIAWQSLPDKYITTK